MILLADPPLQAEIMMHSSIMSSLILELPLCTTKTSLSLIEVPEPSQYFFNRKCTFMDLPIRTLVSPLLNLSNCTAAKGMPSRSAIDPASAGWLLPEKTQTLRILQSRGEGGVERCLAIYIALIKSKSHGI